MEMKCSSPSEVVIKIHSSYMEVIKTTLRDTTAESIFLPIM